MSSFRHFRRIKKISRTENFPLKHLLVGRMRQPKFIDQFHMLCCAGYGLYVCHWILTPTQGGEIISILQMKKQAYKGSTTCTQLTSDKNRTCGFRGHSGFSHGRGRPVKSPVMLSRAFVREMVPKSPVQWLEFPLRQFQWTKGLRPEGRTDQGCVWKACIVNLNSRG